MRITFLGTGTCVHGTDSRAQSSVLIEEESKILVDCGSGTFMRLNQTGIHVNDIDAILLTHNHLDHNADLFTILKARWLENGGRIGIYGPEGTAEFVEALHEAYAYLKKKISYTVFEGEKFSVGGFKVDSIRTKHSITSRAYVISNNGKKVVISGDTSPVREVLEVKCNLLVHELSLPFNSLTEDHTTPESLADMLKFCNAEKIYLTHVYPHAYIMISDILDYLRRHSDLEIFVAADLESVEV